MRSKFKQSGFTLIELLVVIAIIAVLASLAVVTLMPVTKKARDTKRKADLAQVGKFLQAGSCFMPDAGAGDYDLKILLNEFKIKYPQYSSYISQVPKDPKTGTDAVANYRYIISEDGRKCALYANLENNNEAVTLTNLPQPTAGGGNGVLKGVSAGWNGTDKYFQASN